MPMFDPSSLLAIPIPQVSFTVLSLSPSPCHRYILAATDKSRLIIYRTGTNQIVSISYGNISGKQGVIDASWYREESRRYGGWCRVPMPRLPLTPSLCPFCYVVSGSCVTCMAIRGTSSRALAPCGTRRASTSAAAASSPTR
jgi:hypothetical protein